MRRRVGLIGAPLRRRHSKVMHDAAFTASGIDAEYELVELSPTELDAFFLAARSPEWLGFQVTAPYKQEAVSRCDEVEVAAAAVGAVNSVQRTDDGRLVGFNTDVGGFARSVRSDLGRSFGDATVAVAGAGGAARAVVRACLDGGAARVVVGARSPSAAEALAVQADDPRVEGVALGDEFGGMLGIADLAVNATTVGMTVPGMAFDPGLLRTEAAVFDLVYVPAETALIARARSLGLAGVNGLGMLVAQAEEAFARWTGVFGVGAVMRGALEASPQGDDA